MTITKLSAVALASLMLTGAAFAASAPAGGALPNAAYFAVDIAYCGPVAIVPASVTPAPVGAAAVVYEEVLVGAYGGDCAAFYANEVLPRVYLSHEGS